MKKNNIFAKILIQLTLIIVLSLGIGSCDKNLCTPEEFDSQDNISLNLDTVNNMSEGDSTQFADDELYDLNRFKNQVGMDINSKDEAKINKEELFGLTDEDFVVKNGNDFIRLSESIEGKEINEELISARYVDIHHAYDTLVYENIVLLVAPINGGVIFFIELTTPVFETARGIRIGDSISDVFEKYGVTDGDTDREYPSYAYRYELKHLNFYVDENGIVTIIRLGIT